MFGRVERDRERGQAIYDKSQHLTLCHHLTGMVMNHCESYDILLPTYKKEYFE